MNAKSLPPYLFAPIVALSTFACSSDPSAPSGEGDPLAEVGDRLGSSLPLLRTSTEDTTAGANSASAGTSGGMSTPPEYQSDGPNTVRGPAGAYAAASATVTGASATVTSSTLLLGGGGSCGSYTANASSAMLGMVNATYNPDTGGSFGNYSGAANTGGQTFQVLDLSCTTESGEPAIASGTVSVSALPEGYSDSFNGSASVGGSSVTVTCYGGPYSCTTTTVQQTVAACPPPDGSSASSGASSSSSSGASSSSSSGGGGGVNGLCTFTSYTVTPGATGATVSFSFLTSVGASIGVSTSVNGNGSAWSDTAGVNSTTSASLAVYLLE